MENTLENKSKFFAQYWGQRVFNDGGGEYLFYVNESIPFPMHKDFFLELTPLHLISDEDAIELSKMLWGKTHIETMFSVLSNEKAIFEIRLSVENSVHHLKYDYLRSKGYALPYNGLSVSEQVERGWVVLKTKI